MNYATSILGHTAVEQLKNTAKSAVVEIGSDRLTRAELARVGCFNFSAAKGLSAALQRHEVPVTSLRQLYEEIPHTALALPRLGTISLAVLGAAFEARGIGGASPLENYVRRHSMPNTKGDAKNGAVKLTTWHTMKQHEADEHARERKERRQRKATRRNQAHGLRVERFEKRAAS